MMSILLTAVLVVSVTGSVLASHGDATLPGSIFEIDTNANLKVDHAAPSIDWAAVSETRRNDAATGSNDDSYGGGAKEDDICPPTGTGSIPNNKSDLLTFGVYTEPEANGPGYLHLFWTRVLEPSGTTLMDFELNQSTTDCGNGVNPQRTGDGNGPLTDDLLIEYRIDQGGARLDQGSLLVRVCLGTGGRPHHARPGTRHRYDQQHNHSGGGSRWAAHH